MLGNEGGKIEVDSKATI